MDCLFCKIANEGDHSGAVYEDDEVYAFNDINPVAPVHILIVPKRHIQSLAHAEEGDAAIIGKMMLIAKKIAEEKGLAEKGYRVTINIGADGGQTVPHLHIHLIGGRKLKVHVD